ncbi:MAG: ABC transporter substrate-binding protein [Syntrophomonas sp.]
MSLVLLTGCNKTSNTASKTEQTLKPFTVTDMGGRTVTIEKPINKAYASNLIGILYIRTMDITKLGGYTNQLSEDEKKYIPKEYWDLPYLGGWSTANPTANIEELVKANIDVILVTAIVDDKIIKMADKIQSQTGIPTVIVSSDINQLGNAYKLLGQLFQNEERGAKLGQYCVDELNELSKVLATIPKAQAKKIYYAEGANGLETDPFGSMHTQVFDFVGAVNVANIAENTTNGLVGQSTVSLEQIITWNPEYIIRNSTYTGSNNPTSAKAILADPNWAGIKAVKDGRVYQTPALPNNWVDRGPSVNRVLGVKWLANLLYPDVVKLDIRAEAKEFFKLFYNLDLTDEQLNYILADSQ